MQIQEQSINNVVILKPSGPLSQHDADQLKRHIETVLTQDAIALVLDVSAMPLVDSRGLEVLVETSDALAKTGQTLKLCGSNKTLREVFDLTNLASLFEYFEDTKAAVRSV